MDSASLLRHSLLDELVDGRFGPGVDDRIHGFPVPIQDQRRNDLDLRRLGQRGLLVDVYLRHGETVAVFVRDLLILGPVRASVGAPGSPEIHQDGLAALCHLLELFLVFSPFFQPLLFSFL